MQLASDGFDLVTEEDCFISRSEGWEQVHGLGSCVKRNSCQELEREIFAGDKQPSEEATKLELSQ